MNGLEHATPGALVLLAILLSALFAPRLWRYHRDTVTLRRIPGIDAIEGAVARAAELGRPTSFTTSLTGLGPVLYGSLGVLRFVARACAQYRNRLLLPQSAPDVMAVCDQAVVDSYRSVGRLNAVRPQDTVFLTDAQFAFAAGYMGLLQRENVGAAFLFGEFAAESLILAEAGQAVDAMQVAATTSPEQVAFFVCATDATLIGEELFAASGYLGKDEEDIRALFVQDRAKLALLALVVLGVMLETGASIFGYPSGAIQRALEWMPILNGGGSPP